MKKLPLVLVLTLVPILANAQADYPRDILVSWTNADSYVDTILSDGSVLPGGLIEAGDLEHVRIEVYRHNDITPSFTATIPADGEGLEQVELFEGVISRPGTYRIEGYSIVIGGIESDTSEPLFKKYVGKPRSIILRSFD